MQARSHAWLIALCLVAIACRDEQAQSVAQPVGRSEPEAGSRPVRDAATAASSSEAECDQAPSGTPCGAPGRGQHCLFNACVLNACGDGVRGGLEQCDDGNQRSDDGCDGRCRWEPPPGCGNGVLESAEECDDGNEDDADRCTARCTVARCGDLSAGPGEECDDGNDDDLDGCTHRCREAPIPDAGQPIDEDDGSEEDDGESGSGGSSAASGSGGNAGSSGSGGSAGSSGTGGSGGSAGSSGTGGSGGSAGSSGTGGSGGSAGSSGTGGSGGSAGSSGTGGSGGSAGSDAGSGGSAAGSGGSAGSGGIVSSGYRGDAMCDSCRAESCKWVDEQDPSTVLAVFASGCFDMIDPNFREDNAPADDAFLSDCRAVVACARGSGCAYDRQNGGPLRCYCGSRNEQECMARGPAPDAPCVLEWQRAARAQAVADVLERKEDLGHPIGWAYHLLDCDGELCNPAVSSAATGNCTIPSTP